MPGSHILAARLADLILLCATLACLGAPFLDGVDYGLRCARSVVERLDPMVKLDLIDRLLLFMVFLAGVAVLHGFAAWLKPAGAPAAAATEGKTGGRNQVSVVSFPGVHRHQWNQMVLANIWYNYCVVWLLGLAGANSPIEQEIRHIDDDTHWGRIRDLLRDETWFHLWKRSVRTDAQKKLIVVAKSRVQADADGSRFGNFQEAEMKYLREEGIAYSIADIAMIEDINASMAAVRGMQRLSLIAGGALGLFWAITVLAFGDPDLSHVRNILFVIACLTSGILAGLALTKLLGSRVGMVLGLFQAVLIAGTAHTQKKDTALISLAATGLSVGVIRRWHYNAGRRALARLLALPPA